jgi:hypothetical protein
MDITLKTQRAELIYQILFSLFQTTLIFYSVQSAQELYKFPQKIRF